MHLRVDHAGQKVQAMTVDALARRGEREVAHFGDTAVDDSDIAQAGAIVVDDRAAGQDEIECAGHVTAFLATLAQRPM